MNIAEANALRCTTHGMSKSTEYNSYNAMKQRCYYPKHKDYRRYGGAGIGVCDRWRHSFEAFIEDMGRKPSPSHSLDRIDPRKDYSPDNCRWATTFQQARNRRNTIRVQIPDGPNVTLKEAAVHFGADYGAVRYAVHDRGESPLSACQRIGSGVKIKTGPRAK